MGYSDINLSNDLQILADSTSDARDDISKYINNPDADNTDLTNDLAKIHNTMSDSVGNVLSKSYEIQKNATAQTKHASYFLDRGNRYLNDLVSESNHEIDELKIHRDNKKRIIEMQRNRLFKYQYIKKTLLYLIGVILICGVILYIEKLFKNKVKQFTSVLIIVLVSAFSIFLIFRMIDYMRRSKFNFRQYDVDSGGDKYKKTIYNYDRDEITGMGDYALNELDDDMQSGVDNLQKKVDKLNDKDDDESE